MATIYPSFISHSAFTDHCVWNAGGKKTTCDCYVVRLPFPDLERVFPQREVILALADLKYLKVHQPRPPASQVRCNKPDGGGKDEHSHIMVPTSPCSEMDSHHFNLNGPLWI